MTRDMFVVFLSSRSVKFIFHCYSSLIHAQMTNFCEILTPFYTSPILPSAYNPPATLDLEGAHASSCVFGVLLLPFRL
jgi:hypothetical protein